MVQTEGVKYRRPRGQVAGIRVFIDLGTAHDNAEICFEGSGITVERLDGQLSVKLNRPNGDAVNLRLNPGLELSFSRAYLENSSQSGLKATLFFWSPGVRATVSPSVGGLPAYVAPTSLAAGGSLTVKDPTSAYALKIKRFSVSTDTGSQIDLMWDTTPFETFNLGGPGSAIANLTKAELTGPQGALLKVKTSAAAKVTAHATYELV
jgi:hypothetical protein